MSLRRKSCETCFKGKRKCDLTFPICKRCRRIGKECHYTYSVLSDEEATPLDSTGVIEQQNKQYAQRTLTLDIPNFLGPLGEVRPIVGQSVSWQWLVDELKHYPRTFAAAGTTNFIHSAFAPSRNDSLKVASNLCLARQLAPSNHAHHIIFRKIASEVAVLLNNTTASPILQELAQLQAIVLYQIMRLLCGGFEERILAEAQEPAVETLCIRLLDRVNTEFGFVQANWQTWLVAESARRTALVAFLLYCTYCLETYGSSTAFPTMSMLPVSNRPELWESPATFLPQLDSAASYDDFSQLWLTNPYRQLDAFEKMLLVPCKGLDTIESYRRCAEQSQGT